MIPSVEEQRRQFLEWDSSPAKVKYREVRTAGGGHVGSQQERWELFARRWRPAKTPADGWTPPPLHPE